MSAASLDRSLGPRLRGALRSALFATLAGLAFLPGLALLSHAAWFALAAAHGAALASVVVGGAWCTIGTGLLVIARRPGHRQLPPGRLPTTAFAEAFLTGLDLGRAAAGSSRRSL